MQAVIISAGTELITGQTVDTNAAWLSAELARLGVDVAAHVTVGDEIVPLRRAIERAIGEAALIIITGGLGPTLDDVTRDAIALAIGQPLEESGEALAHITQFFAARQREMHPSNIRQAMIPAGCLVIPNPLGTAPGISWHRGETWLAAMPGVPAEMKAMFRRAVAPSLETKPSLGRCQIAAIASFGLAEAKVGELLADLMERGRNPSVGTTASRAIITIRIVANGRDQPEARRLLEADLAEVRRRLGSTVFGEGGSTLQEAVGHLLCRAGKTVSTAESCTGGLLAKCLTDVPGSSAYFMRGYVAYSNESKMELLNVAADTIATHGAISEPVAAAMAAGCRLAAGADLALSITGIAGPDGGRPPDKPVGLVYVGLADAAGVEVKKLLLGDTLGREEIRDRSTKIALNLLRLRLFAAG